MSTKTGVPMQHEPVRVRYVASRGTNAKLSTADIPAIRKWLRTDLSIAQIAEKFGVWDQTLRYFIRHRGICDLRERTQFLQKQKLISRGPEFTDTLTYKPGRGQA